MNKQELIDYCNAIKENKSQIINCIDVNGIIKKIEQLDEPQRPVVPQFVADLIEEARIYEWDLDDVFDHIVEEPGDSEIYIWFYTPGNIDVFARAWLDGYEVEKEKQYLVRIKGIMSGDDYLNFDSFKKEWYLADKVNHEVVTTHHTRKELEEANFGWVFDCPGVEIEEVEE